MSRKAPEPEIRRPLTRRQMLERIALALTATGVAPFELAWGEHVHREAREEKEKTGDYQPKLFKSSRVPGHPATGRADHSGRRALGKRRGCGCSRIHRPAVQPEPGVG